MLYIKKLNSLNIKKLRMKIVQPKQPKQNEQPKQPKQNELIHIHVWTVYKQQYDVGKTLFTLKEIEDFPEEFLKSPEFEWLYNYTKKTILDGKENTDENLFYKVLIEIMTLLTDRTAITILKSFNENTTGLLPLFLKQYDNKPTIDSPIYPIYKEIIESNYLKIIFKENGSCSDSDDMIRNFELNRNRKLAYMLTCILLINTNIEFNINAIDIKTKYHYAHNKKYAYFLVTFTYTGNHSSLMENINSFLDSDININEQKKLMAEYSQLTKNFKKN